MKKRTMVSLTFYLFLSGALLGISCAIFSLPLYLHVLDILVVSISITLVFKFSRCPYCGRLSLPVKPCLPSNVYCRNCGKEIEGYDEKV